MFNMNTRNLLSLSKVSIGTVSFVGNLCSYVALPNQINNYIYDGIRNINFITTLLLFFFNDYISYLYFFKKEKKISNMTYICS